jgi:hypothetical protein
MQITFCAGSLNTRTGLCRAGNTMWIGANQWGVQPQRSSYLYTIQMWLYTMTNLQVISTIGQYSAYSWWYNMTWPWHHGSQYLNMTMSMYPGVTSQPAHWKSFVDIVGSGNACLFWFISASTVKWYHCLQLTTTIYTPNSKCMACSKLNYN